MKTKIFIASSYYPIYLDYFYNNKFSDLDYSYDSLYKQIMSDRFSWSDSWKYYLEKLGDYEVNLVILNNELMQKKWAEEHKFTFTDNWIIEILTKQIEEFKPDILFSHDTDFITPLIRKNLKSKLKIKYVLVWDGVGVGLSNPNAVQGGDIILSCNQLMVDEYNKKGFKALLFNFGFDKRVLDSLKFDKIYNTTFVGGISLRENGHISRSKLLIELTKKIDISYFLSGVDNWQPWSKEQIYRLLTNKWNEYLSIFTLGSRNKGEKFGIDMYQVLAESKITINSHIDLAKNFAGNIRLYESTGVGACLLTDWKTNLKDLFVIGKEIVAYKSIDEAVEMVRWLLNNPIKCQQIALSGQKRTLKDYSYDIRFKQLIYKLDKTY